MQIKKIKDNIVRVIINISDLEKMNLDLNSLYAESAELNSFLYNLMERIREETGFNPYGGQILMEAMPMDEDNISIMVSRIEVDKKTISKERFKKIKSVRVRDTAKNNAIKTDFKDVFYIEAFEDLCTFLISADDALLDASSLYSIDKMYCITVSKDKLEKKDVGLLSEFSYKKSYYPMQAEYVKEHGRLIADGLKAMSDGIRRLNC